MSVMTRVSKSNDSSIHYQELLVAVFDTFPVVLRHVQHRGELLRLCRGLKVLHVGVHGGDAQGHGIVADRAGHLVPDGGLSDGDSLAMSHDIPGTKRLND